MSESRRHSRLVQVNSIQAGSSCAAPVSLDVSPVHASPCTSGNVKDLLTGETACGGNARKPINRTGMAGRQTERPGFFGWVATKAHLSCDRFRHDVVARPATKDVYCRQPARSPHLCDELHLGTALFALPNGRLVRLVRPHSGAIIHLVREFCCREWNLVGSRPMTESTELFDATARAGHIILTPGSCAGR